MTLPTGSTDFPQGLGTVNIEGKIYTPVSIDLPNEAVRIIQRTDEVGNPSDYQIRMASEKITGNITLNQDPPTLFPLGWTVEQSFDRHARRLPKSGQKGFYDNGDGILFFCVTDVKVVRSEDKADQIELGVLLEHFSPSSLDLNVTADLNFTDIALQPTKAIFFDNYFYKALFFPNSLNNVTTSNNLSLDYDEVFTNPVTGSNVGSNLRIKTNSTDTPQIEIDTSLYKMSKSGRVELEYYVPTGSPLIGKYFHIGSADDKEFTYTSSGHQIQGNTISSIVLYYGEEFGGKDKPTEDSTNVPTDIISPTDFSVSDYGISHNGATADVSITFNNDSISDGVTSKDEVLKVENNTTKVPQLRINGNSSYSNSTSGYVTFNYYVPEDHPIVGGYWHIGTSATASPAEEISYSPYGAKIIGGEWTTTTVKYGSYYGGIDKDDPHRFLTILRQKYADGDVNKIQAEDGDAYYIANLNLRRITTKSGLNKAFLTVTDGSSSSSDGNTITPITTNANHQYYIRQIHINEGYKPIDFMDCGNWWIDSTSLVSAYNFGVAEEYMWRIELSGANVSKKIGITPADSGEIIVSLALRIGNFYRAEVDLTNSSSHIISYTTNSEGEFTDAGINATKVQKFDIVVDTDEPNDIDLVFDLIYDP